MDSKQRDPEEILSLREISVKVARSAELQTDRATAPAPARPSRFSRPGAALARECARCKPKSPGSKDSAYTGTCAVWGADFPGGAEAAGSAPVVPCLEARRGRRGLCPGDRGGALLPRARVPHRPLVCPMPTRFLRALAHACRRASSAPLLMRRVSRCAAASPAGMAVTTSAPRGAVSWMGGLMWQRGARSGCSATAAATGVLSACPHCPDRPHPATRSPCSTRRGLGMRLRGPDRVSSPLLPPPHKACEVGAEGGR
jgi:hypothetical protein